MKLSRSLLLLVVAVFGFSATARAADHHVSLEGNDANPGTANQPLRTIQAAVNRATAGEKILVSAGVYGEKLQFDASGAEGIPITLMPLGDDEVVIDGSSIGGLGSTDALLQLDQASFITVKGLTIRNSGANCIRATQGGNIILRDLDVSGCARNGIAFYDKATPSYSRVMGCRIHNVGQSGILLWHNNGGHFMIHDNEIHHIVGSGNYDAIQANDTPYVIVRYNDVSHIGTEGDYIDLGGDQGSPSSWTHHIVVEGNKIHRADGPPTNGALKLNNRPRRVIYRGNLLDGMGMIFYEQPFAEVAVYHNTIMNAASHSLQLWNKDTPGTFAGIRIKNNVFAHSGGRLLMHGPEQRDGGPSSILLDGNVYAFGASSGIEWAMEGSNTDYGPGAAEFDRWRAETGQEPSGGTWTPMTVDELVGSFGTAIDGLPDGSDGADAGVVLTRATSPGSGNVVPVLESFYFFDGFDMQQGDYIQVGSHSAWIIDIREDTDELVLDRDINWNLGARVSLVYYGSSPDAGAVEGTPPAPGTTTLERTDTAPAAPSPSP